MSAAGKCPRQLAYAYHGFSPNGKEMDSRAYLVFWAGDLTEMTLVALAKVAGCQITATGFGQLKVKLKIGDKEIEGHPDGLILHESELLLLEVKSMSSYSYEKFEKGEIDGSYIAQVNLYLAALGLKRCVFVAQNKDNGVISERIVERDDALIEKLKTTLNIVLNSTKENLPDKPYAPNEKGILPWQCLYCKFWGTCWPEAKQVLVGTSYKLKTPIKEKEEEKVNAKA